MSSTPSSLSSPLVCWCLGAICPLCTAQLTVDIGEHPSASASEHGQLEGIKVRVARLQSCQNGAPQTHCACTAGRKRTLGVSCAVTALSGMCSAVVPSFWWYFVFRVFTGANVAGIISTSFLLATEPVGLGYRGVAILSTGVLMLTFCHTVKVRTCLRCLTKMRVTSHEVPCSAWRWQSWASTS